MKLTKAQMRQLTALRAELKEKGVPDLITRGEAQRICNDYALDAPMFARGDRSTPFKTINVMIYMVQRGVSPTQVSRYTLKIATPFKSGQPMEPSWEQRVDNARGERTQARQIRALYRAYND